MSRFAMKRAAMCSAVMQKSAIAALLVAVLASPAFAEDAAEQYQTVGDYRWALYTSCSVVFVCMTVYLVMTHRSGAKLGEDVEHLERRIDELE